MLPSQTSLPLLTSACAAQQRGRRQRTVTDGRPKTVVGDNGNATADRPRPSPRRNGEMCERRETTSMLPTTTSFQRPTSACVAQERGEVARAGDNQHGEDLPTGKNLGLRRAATGRGCDRQSHPRFWRCRRQRQTAHRRRPGPAPRKQGARLRGTAEVRLSLTTLLPPPTSACAATRLAEEHGAAQERGEVARAGANQHDEVVATANDLGLRRDEIHEARRLRDAERDNPGAVDRA